MNRFVLLSLTLLATSIGSSDAANCQIIPPLDGAASQPQYGLVINPGSGNVGSDYSSLAGRIQDLFPGELWVGLLDTNVGDLDNVNDASTAVSQCTEAAQ